MKIICAVLCACFLSSHTFAASSALLGWNNLGMHCMDSDYSVFSVLPPYNTIEAQLIINGRLVTSSNYTVSYRAVADAQRSINTTSIGKGNFYQFNQMIFGAPLEPDHGLANFAMPGPSNTAQAMFFEVTNAPAPGAKAKVNWYRAEGIPIMPYDDAGQKNPYPMMRLVAATLAGQPIATNDIVLPVSDEMDCRLCHGSGGSQRARPAAGWVWDGIQERDYRLNILRLHDESRFAQEPEQFAAALKSLGLNPLGIYRSVTMDQRPVLCASCHASEALPGSGKAGIQPLTTAIHSLHATVRDPGNGLRLDNADNRSACYLCHPGSATKCLRGAMGAAIAADGSMAMHCQSCHGNMSQVGAQTRVGWLQEPNCGSCHSGTALQNSGQIRFTSVFTDTNHTVRAPANPTFSTSANTPAKGLSLYRFSSGHGGLQCSACHGSTHAEYPSSHSSDNVASIRLQGHPGVIGECVACHTNSPVNVTGGPHGMHAVGETWIGGHQSAAQQDAARCRACHGLDYRGTVLSRTFAARTISGQSVFQGAIIGCYMCHDGPSGDGSGGATPTVSNVSTSTVATPVSMVLPAIGTGLSYRIVSQPRNGAVGLSGNVAKYFPDNGFTGADSFTFAVYNGSRNSRLGTGTVTVTQGHVSLGLAPRVPESQPARWPVAFAARATITNSTSAPEYLWEFGDGTTGNGQFPQHAYAAPGDYQWKVKAVVNSPGAPAGGTAETTASGTIHIGDAVVLTSLYAPTASAVMVSWPEPFSDALLQRASSPAGPWLWVTNGVVDNQALLPTDSGAQFFRLLRPW